MNIYARIHSFRLASISVSTFPERWWSQKYYEWACVSSRRHTKIRQIRFDLMIFMEMNFTAISSELTQ